MDRYKNFTVLIGKISREIRKIKTEEMKEFGLKSPYVSCLYYFFKEEKLTSKQLTEICEEDKAAVSRSIDFLEKEGYIYCESDAKKRYRDYLVITEKGKKIGKILVDKIDKVLEQASNGLSDQDRTNLYQSLELISNNLHKINNKTC